MDSWLWKLRNLDKNEISHVFCLSIARKNLNFSSFQFKLFHRKIATNDYLYKIGISLTDICTFCEQNTESLIHLFWDCKYVQNVWQKIQHWLIQHQIKPQDFPLTLSTCLGLVDSTEDILLQHALLIGRYHIYSSKIKKTLPNLQVFSQTFLNGPWSATPLFLFTIENLVIIFYSEHVKAKATTFKLLKITKHAFRNTT